MAENEINLENLKNKDPALLSDMFAAVGNFFAAYGWIMFAFAILVWYIGKRLQPWFMKQNSLLESRRQYSTYDSDIAFRKAESMAEARQRLQEEYNAKAARFAEEQKAKDEEKQKQRIEDWENHQKGKGYKSKYKPQDSQTTESSSRPSSVSTSSNPKRNVYRMNDYNPLGGSSGGSTYRPPRCGPSGGG